MLGDQRVLSELRVLLGSGSLGGGGAFPAKRQTQAAWRQTVVAGQMSARMPHSNPAGTDPSSIARRSARSVRLGLKGIGWYTVGGGHVERVALEPEGGGPWGSAR